MGAIKIKDGLFIGDEFSAQVSTKNFQLIAENETNGAPVRIGS